MSRGACLATQGFCVGVHIDALRHDVVGLTQNQPLDGIARETIQAAINIAT